MSDSKKSERKSFARMFPLTLLFLFISFFCASAQKAGNHKIGEPCPPFKLEGIEHYAKPSASLSDFAGKWLVLDFWTSDCVACVEAFPKLNHIYRQHKDSLQIVLVGRDHLIYGSGVARARSIYERVRKKIKLEIPIAYDTIQFKRFSIPGPGYAIWIDAKGIIRARTLSYEVNEKNVSDMLSGAIGGLAEARDSETRNRQDSIFDWHKPFLVNGNGGNDSAFLFRSLLSPWTPDMEQVIIDFKKTGWNWFIKNGIQFFGANLSMLYRIAYHGTSDFSPGDSLYGSYWPELILETKDTVPFTCDFSTGYHLYCYSVIVPSEKATTEFLQSAMKEDLRRYFGYKVRLENRKMPCWDLICTETCQSILTQGGPPSNNYNQGVMDATGFRIQNQPVNALIGRLFNYQQGLPIINRTNISGNIDITLDAMLTDIDDIRKGLQKNGLDLVKSEKDMNVIVILDN